MATPGSRPTSAPFPLLLAAGWLWLATAPGCGPNVLEEGSTDTEPGGDTTSGPASNSAGGTSTTTSTSTSTTSNGTTTSSDTTGDTDGEALYVDCATLPPDGTTIAGGELSPTGFPTRACNPRNSGSDVYRCCSDDPAALGGTLPSYEGKNIDGGTPIFSGHNNDLGTFGMCVRTDDIPFGSGLLEPEAENCPIPCNPTWDASLIDTVCGAGRVCCQTLELRPADCVLDDGVWRPVRGTDIGTLTNWAPSNHVTHQDPNGVGCLQLVGGDQNSPQFLECVEQLSVADQRGYCMALGPGQACPHAAPSYVDACEAMN